VLTLFAVAFALSGILLKSLAAAIPKLGQLIAETFSQPAAWFVLLMGLFFVIRPIWSSKSAPVVAHSNAFPALAADAEAV
jgi:hypothetical protein